MRFKNERVIDKQTMGNCKVEIIELEDLKGAGTTNSAQKLFFYRQAGMTMKMVRVTLSDDIPLSVEAGAFYYSVGDIQRRVDTDNIGRRLIASKMTGESVTRPTYYGRGEIVLTPSFKHFKITPLKNASVIVNKGMYYAALGNISVEPVIERNMVTASVSGTQIKLTGTGLAILNIPVPFEEVITHKMNGETMIIDGNFFILRESSLNYSMELTKSATQMILPGQEKVVAKLSGRGRVWLAPTAPVYEDLVWKEAEDVDNYGTYNKAKDKNIRR